MVYQRNGLWAKADTPFGGSGEAFIAPNCKPKLRDFFSVFSIYQKYNEELELKLNRIVFNYLLKILIVYSVCHRKKETLFVFQFINILLQFNLYLLMPLSTISIIHLLRAHWKLSPFTTPSQIKLVFSMARMYGIFSINLNHE